MSGRGTMVSQCEANLWRMFTSNSSKGHFIQKSKLFVSGHGSFPSAYRFRTHQSVRNAAGRFRPWKIQQCQNFCLHPNQRGFSIFKKTSGQLLPMRQGTKVQGAEDVKTTSQQLPPIFSSLIFSAWHLPRYLVTFLKHILWHLYINFFSFFGCFSTSTQIFVQHFP